MIKGVVFDMDGLMFDTEKIVFRNWSIVMKENNYDYNMDIYKKTVGLRHAETEKLYRSIYGEDFDYQTLRTRVSQMYVEYTAQYGVPKKEGLMELLEFLKENKILTAVATSTREESASRTLKIAGVTEYFSAFMFGDMVKKGKPDPEIFERARLLIGTEKENTLALEDSINGVKSAYNAGLKTVMVPDMLEPDEETQKLLYGKCRNLKDVITIVKNENNM